MVLKPDGFFLALLRSIFQKANGCGKHSKFILRRRLLKCRI
ncbi:hypothetical protein SBF1_2050006 [Candidatus Desulfosporosinus infrequens]|uniref:Uncharacterized protein n=1 Tax=Candidatus Desulfosporosinus infrequens TaxID=2043169 RepID=A0A2U3KHX1_9FIRM|nr:hypothetical protein SBF1_2050006 [Candidatus Desulfosporosinus infrequens]